MKGMKYSQKSDVQIDRQPSPEILNTAVANPTQRRQMCLVVVKTSEQATSEYSCAARSQATDWNVGQRLHSDQRVVAERIALGTSSDSNHEHVEKRMFPVVRISILIQMGFQKASNKGRDNSNLFLFVRIETDLANEHPKNTDAPSRENLDPDSKLI
jgi:hypothetical protein